MPLFDHLGELRRRLTIVVVSVFAAAIVLYFATPVVLDILEDPIRSFVPDGKFYITTTLGGFGLRFSLAIKMAVVMCTPMIIWQIPAGTASQRAQVGCAYGARLDGAVLPGRNLLLLHHHPGRL
jgi:Sec-independent protein secretion pathway component TatC